MLLRNGLDELADTSEVEVNIGSRFVSVELEDAGGVVVEEVASGCALDELDEGM